MKQLFSMLMLIILTIALMVSVNAKIYDAVTKTAYLTDANIRLTDNSDKCINSCFATGTNELKKDGKLLDTIKFYALSGSKRYNARLDYQVFIKDGLKWIAYDGHTLPAGVYEWKIEAVKPKQLAIDWIATFTGEEVKEWALWQTPSIYDYYNGTIESSKWTTSGSGAGYSFVEDTKSVNSSANNNAAVQGGTSSLYSSSLPNYNQTQELLFRALMHITSSGGSPFVGNCGIVELKIFGTQVKYVLSTTPGGGNPCSQPLDDSVYTVRQNLTVSTSTFDVYDDGVFLQKVTATNNRIEINGEAYAATGVTTYVKGSFFTVNYSYSENTLNVTLNSPINLKQQKNNTMEFNVSTSIIVNNLKNLSLIINNVFNETKTVYGQTNQTLFTKNFPLGRYNWSVLMCDDFDNCLYSENRTFTISTVEENNRTYNNVSFETDSETFSINISFKEGYSYSNAYFVYNGTPYSVSRSTEGSNTILTKTLTIPLVSTNTNIPFYWNISLSDGSYYVTETLNQTVQRIYLSLCNATNNIPYINFTFKDEISTGNLNASLNPLQVIYYLGSGEINRTLLFINATSNPSYAFCFSPPSRSVSVGGIASYYASGYPQRNYYISSAYSNNTANTVLYLLSASEGIYASYSLQNQAGGSLSGVTVVSQASSGGSYFTVGQCLTGSDGICTFWVNPNAQHQVSFSKLGYATSTISHYPTQSVYTVYLTAATSGNVSYTSSLEGIKYDLAPKSGFLARNTLYQFNYNISASLCNLISYRLSLELPNGTVLSTVSGSQSCGENLSTTYNTGNYSTIYGKYYINLGDGELLIDPSVYSMGNLTAGTNSIYRFFQDLKSYSVDTESSYTTMFFLFLILVVSLSAFTFATGVELGNPGISTVLIMFFVIVASISGFFTIDFSPYDFMNQYGIATASVFLSVGYLLSKWRDS